MRPTFTIVTLPLAAVVLATAAGAVLRGAPARPAATLADAVASITPALVRSHVEFLSHDLLEGRDTGERGFEIAREYVASQFRRIGLDARSNGSYLQPFGVLAAGSDTGSELRVGGETITAADASFAPDWQGRRGEIRAPGAFAGEGLVTTGRDDYAGLDVHGRIVFLLPGVPADWTEHPERSLLGRTKIDAAMKRGAIAVAMLSLNGQAQQGRAMALADGTASAPRAAVTIGAAASKRLLAAWGSAPQAVGDVVLSVRRERTPLRSWNVVGVIPGNDPALAGESIVFTAHLDHVGVGEPDETGDRIFNGTHDNAVGVGKLLASAEAMARLAPKRTIVFAAVGAEERGMLGSYYYIAHPVAANPVAAINHDGGLEGPATDDVFAFGAEYSSLGAALDAAARRIGMRVASEYPTPFSPSQALLFRSDHYPFLRAGVPAIYLMDGFSIGRDPERGRAQWANYLARFNHQQRDNFDPAWTFESPVRMAALSVGLAWDLANAPARPAMKPNTMFPSPQAAPSTPAR